MFTFQTSLFGWWLIVPIALLLLVVLSFFRWRFLDVVTLLSLILGLSVLTLYVISRIDTHERRVFISGIPYLQME